MPTVTGPSRSRLDVARRVKAVFPLLLVVSITLGYNVIVHHGQPIVLRELPHDSFKFNEDDPPLLSFLIGTGLDRIKAAGFEMSWDQRVAEPESNPSQPRQKTSEELRREWEFQYYGPGGEYERFKSEREGRRLREQW